MSSQALIKWKNERAAELDEMADAHATVGGTGPGRRCATQQINHAYAVLLSSQFQGFCRDVHSEAVAKIILITPPTLQNLIQVELTRNRLLDRGNPWPGNIGSDFQRLDLALWAELQRYDSANDGRNKKLAKLMAWRNAIAHQDFSRTDIELQGGRRSLRLGDVRSWRSACNRLALHMDIVVGRHVAKLTGTPPW